MAKRRVPRKKSRTAPESKPAAREPQVASPASAIARAEPPASTPGSTPGSTPRSPETKSIGANPARFPVVGLGASAGGLAALQLFFQHAEPASGMAYVVVTHQTPGRASLLPELLAKSTPLPVVTASDRMRLEPNHVYVAAPGCCLEAVDEHLRLSAIDTTKPLLPIDHFFRSLARNEGDHGIGIVLSGNGSDGTVGIAELKGASGMTMAQDPQTAQYAGMPSSAIATQLVDYVLPPEDMPEQLLRYVREKNRPALHLLDADDGGSSSALQRILRTLRARNGNDFSSYKKSTIRRRIERRMHVHGISDPQQYAKFLEQTPFEADALFKELLISVTSFFRDPPAFEALEHELAALIEHKNDDAPLRAWVAGCATGEEAYSVAIVMREQLERARKDFKIQVFATDLDQQAVDIARSGRYPDGIAADVSAARLQRFFTREDGGYRVNKDLRELIVFAVQNVIKDPPFTKLDVVTCRNLLIYLESDLQKRVLALLAYALQPGGLLLLGTSESVTGFEDRLTTLDKRWKLAQRKHGARQVHVPELPANLPAIIDHHPPPFAIRETKRGAGVAPLAEKMLLAQFVPPTIVVSDRGDMIYAYGRLGEFFEPAAGEPTHNAFHMAREGLRNELPAIVRRAAASDGPVLRRALHVKTNGGHSRINVGARKLSEPEALRGAILVSFEPDRDGRGAVEDATAIAAPPRRRGRASRRDTIQGLAALEDELQRTRETLQGTVEEFETSNEELKSTNEELQSTNEELQSANEELETSREEMQSLNEELHTVNAELEERNRALLEAADDMQNLLNSTDVATVFLDGNLAIRRFTTPAKKVFSLIDTDVGRPISDLATNLAYESLFEDARGVLDSLAFREREVQTKSGAWRQMRIMPYRTHENAIDGLVLTFVDIDRLKRAEQVADAARAFAEDIVENLTQGVVLLDEHWRVVSANRAFCSMFRTDLSYLVGVPIDAVFDGNLGLAEVAAGLRSILFDRAAGAAGQLQAKVSRADGVQDLVFSVRRVKPEAGQLAHMVLSVDNVTTG
jgi:two-component system, chemotaxis family, CheB/CheR fusion protein